MEYKDDTLKGLLKMSKVHLPFEDFDERLLTKIQRLDHERKTIRTYKRNATIFFVVGTIFGFGMNYLLTEILLKVDFKESIKDSLIFGSQLIYVLLIVIFSSAMNKFIKWRKESI